MNDGELDGALGTDAHFMEIALGEARAAVGRTSPNPPVGAVIVKSGRVIARGRTAPAGGPHAEVLALESAGKRARSATLYTTLEPCDHLGRTGPCTERILGARIARVVVGTRDRNPRVSGRGLRRLRRAGVAVEVLRGPAATESARLGRPFFTWVREGRPFVVLKMAATLDGRIATATGDARWVSGTEARSRVHRWRARFDAVLVGAGTVRADDPRLTARENAGRDPTRVLLDGRLGCDPEARIFRQRSKAPTLIVLPPRGARARRTAFARKGVEFLEVAGARGRVELPALLQALGDREIVSLLIEGGAEVAGAFLAAGLVDELRLFLSPKVLGAGPAWLSLASAPTKMADALGLTLQRFEPVGPDLLLVATPAP